MTTCHLGGGGVTPYNGLYVEAPPERGTFFRFQVYKRVEISQVEVYKRVGKLGLPILNFVAPPPPPLPLPGMSCNWEKPVGVQLRAELHRL